MARLHQSLTPHQARQLRRLYAWLQLRAWFTAVWDYTHTPWDWNGCVAIHETSGDFTAHGSDFSSAYGVMNKAVREHAYPDAAQRILSGTSPMLEQLAMAKGVADEHGITAWDPVTVAACA